MPWLFENKHTSSNNISGTTKRAALEIGDEKWTFMRIEIAHPATGKWTDRLHTEMYKYIP